MINLTEQQIKEIAEYLDCGMRCYYNKRTGEIKIILNFDSWMVADEEPWKEDIKEIEENLQDYVEFEGMESHEVFRVMADFAESIDNSKLREKLINALNRPKPFRNFKWQIDNSGESRQVWFDFKNERYIEWVKDQLKAYNWKNDNE